VPTEKSKGFSDFDIPAYIAVEFPTPIINIGFGYSHRASLVSVKKTAVDEYDLLLQSEDKVGRSGQVSAMETKTVSEPVNEAPNSHFRRCIPRSDE
jgi:hypothetical protein